MSVEISKGLNNALIENFVKEITENPDNSFSDEEAGKLLSYKTHNQQIYHQYLTS